MLRICLILSILVGLGGLAVSHLKVADKIKTITDDLEATTKQKTDAQAAESKAKGESRKAGEKLVAAEKELEQTKADLEAKTSFGSEQKKRADKFETDFNKTLEERNEARQSLAAWNALGIPVDQIRQLQQDLKNVREEREVIAGENTILLRKTKILQAELDRYQGKNPKVILPAGLKGKVLAVDPKYDFVVLDIGSNQGALDYGEMMVSREGKLVAKVQIVRVEANRCIANILPGWKQAEVMEGDSVLY